MSFSLGGLAGLSGGLGLAGGLIGGFAGQKGLKKHKANLMGMYDPLLAGNSYNFSLAELYQKKMLDRIRAGGEASANYIQRTGTLARRGAERAGKQVMAAATQDAASRGLYNTTVLDANRRGAIQVSQNLIDSAEMATGSAMASLEERTAAAEAQGLNMLAELQIRRNAAELGIGMDRIQSYGSNYVPTSGEIIGQSLTGLGQMGMGLIGLLGGTENTSILAQMMGYGKG